MTDILVTAFSIAAICVVIIDFAQIVEPIKRKLYYLRYTKESAYSGYDLKPFDCSPCASLWVYVIWTLSTSAEIDPIALAVGGAIAVLMALAIRKYIIL